MARRPSFYEVKGEKYEVKCHSGILRFLDTDI